MGRGKGSEEPPDESAAPSADTIANEIAAAKVALAFELDRSVTGATIINGVAIAVLFFDPAAPWVSPSTALWALAVRIYFAMLRGRYFALTGDQRVRQAAHYANLITFGAIFGGACWGVAFAIHFDPSNLISGILLPLLVFGTVTASLLYRGPIEKAVYGQFAATLLPAFVTFLLEDDFEFRILGAFVLLGASSTVLMGRKINRELDGSFRIRFENSSLVKELQLSKEELERALFRAEAGNRAKAEFLSVMSHELRTPLNGIAGAAQLLPMTKLTPAQSSYVEMIRQSSQRLAVLLSDLLEIAGDAASGRASRPVPLDLAHEARHVLGAFATAADTKKLKLVDRCGPEGTAFALADERRFRQALMKLVDNAVKFTELGSVTIEINALGEAWRIAVRDTGPGLGSLHLGDLFLPFAQADKTHSRRHEGAGLGLALARRYVEEIGGQIGCDTEPGGGLTFWIELPAAAVDAVEEIPFQLVAAGKT